MRTKRITLVAATVSAVVGLMLHPAVATAAPSDTDPPMGLMIQVSTLAGAVSPAGLKVWLDEIRSDHHSSARSGFVNTVVLQDIADTNGALYTSYLDVLAPFLPGGATPIFSKAYVGTVDLPWTGQGSKYIDGIEDPAFQTRNLDTSRSAAASFVARYPRSVIDWYVTYEANLSGFWDVNLEGAYRSYLQRLMSRLSGIRAHRAFLWSPAFWTPYSSEPSWGTSALAANLGDLFTRVPVPLSLALQDMVGQSGGTETPVTAVEWVRYLKGRWSSKLASVQINAEQFTDAPDGAFTAGSANAVSGRLQYYASNSISLGPAWEIRYWHQRIYGS